MNESFVLDMQIVLCKRKLSKLLCSYEGIEQHIVFGLLTPREIIFSVCNSMEVLGSDLQMGCGELGLAAATKQVNGIQKPVCCQSSVHVRSLTPEERFRKPENGVRYGCPETERNYKEGQDLNRILSEIMNPILGKRAELE